MVSPEFTGQKRIDPEDPDEPLALPMIEEHQYRVTADEGVRARAVHGRRWQVWFWFEEPDGWHSLCRELVRRPNADEELLQICSVQGSAMSG
jgi:hypothetical protein